MYRKILVPVDMAHTDQLEKAIATAADVSKLYDAPILFVGVTATTPGPVAHTPAEFTRKLQDFADEQARRRGVEASSCVYVSHDPGVDLDQTLNTAVAENQADLVVMASHVPGLPEHIFASNAGYMASHAAVSVLVVRP